MRKDQKTIEKLIKNLSEDVKLIDEGPDTNVFLGIKVDTIPTNGTLTMTHLALINRILKELSLIEGSAKIHDILVNRILSKGEKDSEPIQDWNCRSVISMMTFFASSTRIDTLFAVHQCAKFNSYPRRCHKSVVKRVGIT